MISSKGFMKERDTLHGFFRSVMPEIGASFDNLMDHTFKDGALPSKMKELIALGISVSVRCEPCMQYHIEKAAEQGATKEEILETMAVGYEMAVGQVVPPLRKVLYSNFADKK
jgi:AhpD family alkylhydroperoxidase